MDNVSKALVIAGGILIAIMVIGVALYVLNNARQFASSADSQARLNAVQSFNRYYESFVQPNGRILGIDVLNIKNRSLDDSSVDKKHIINVDVSQKIIDALNAATGAELMDKEFSCSFDGYDSEGYITHITIR